MVNGGVSRSLRQRFRRSLGLLGGVRSAMTAPPGQAFPNVALLWRFTRRTVGSAPQRRMKFGPCAQALPAGLRARRVLERSRIASISLMRAASLSRVGRWPLRPVLKHGPRSLTCTRVVGCTKPKGAVKANLGMIFAQSRRFNSTSSRLEQQERTRWDPKDGELCLARLKSGETLMEDRSDSDVQIDRRSWV